MINKKSLWFLTLFSLILVLSIYYITMPSELLLTPSKNLDNKEETNKAYDCKGFKNRNNLNFEHSWQTYRIQSHRLR